MIEEIDGAPLSNGADHDVPVMGIDPVATAEAGKVVKAKPKRKKRKAKARANRIDPILQLRESQAASMSASTTVVPNGPTHEEAPSPSIVQGGGDFDRGARFRSPLRRTSSRPDVSAAPAEPMGGTLRLGSQGDHVTLRQYAWAAAVVVVICAVLALA